MKTVTLVLVHSRCTSFSSKISDAGNINSSPETAATRILINGGSDLSG
jgi:hypothetical protein